MSYGSSTFCRLSLPLIRLAMVAAVLAVCCATSDDTPDCPPQQGPSGAPISDPAWHPSGDFVLFDLVPLIRVGFPNGPECPGEQTFDWVNAGVYTYSPTTRTTLKMARWAISGRSWSPAGDRLLVDSAGDIYSVGFDGTRLDTLDIRRLTFTGSNHGPICSPDGSSIAYFRTVECQSPDPLDSTSCGSLVMDSQGSGKRKVANGYHPRWFPDSRRLAYVGLYNDLFVIDLLDSTQVQLTNFGSASQSSIYDLAVSPDGSTIAFCYQKGGGDVNIWAIDPDGTNRRKITREGVLDAFGWHPDSRRIAYVSYRVTDWSAQNGTLWSIDVQTGEKEMIFNGILQ